MVNQIEEIMKFKLQVVDSMALNIATNTEIQSMLRNYGKDANNDSSIYVQLENIIGNYPYSSSFIKSIYIHSKNDVDFFTGDYLSPECLNTIKTYVNSLPKNQYHKWVYINQSQVKTMDRYNSLSYFMELKDYYKGMKHLGYLIINAREDMLLDNSKISDIKSYYGVLDGDGNLISALSPIN